VGNSGAGVDWTRMEFDAVKDAEVNEMNRLAMRCGIAIVALGGLVAGAGMGLEAPAAPAAPAQAHNNVWPAIKWKRSDYTCEGGAKVTVYLGAQMAKVRYEEKVYLMKQTQAADGNRHSDGKVEQGGGRIPAGGYAGRRRKEVVKGCKVVKP
jgi:Membrane-bound lysozyme-inhibitor of c-type lysozyme